MSRDNSYDDKNHPNDSKAFFANLRQIMGGLAVLIIAVVYLTIAFKVVTALKTTKARYAASVIFVLLPTADAILGRAYLTYLCNNEGGLKVYEVAQNVEGFLDTPGEYLLKKYGYAFIEGNIRSDGRVDRTSIVNGTVVHETNVPQKSLYRIRRTESERDALFMRWQYLAEEIRSGKTLASSTQILFKGGWAERLLGGFTDAGAGAVAWCPETRPEVRWEQTIVNGLRPPNRQ